MSESKIHDLTMIGQEVLNSPKFATGLSAYLLSVNWIEMFSDTFKYASSFIAFVTLIVVLRNHILTRKKLQLEIEKLTREANKSKGESDGREEEDQASQG